MKNLTQLRIANDWLYKAYMSKKYSKVLMARIKKVFAKNHNQIIKLARR